VLKNLEQRLDVVDFATPVHTIDTRQQGNNAQMHIRTQANSEYIAYQSGDTFTIEITPMTQTQQDAAEKRRPNTVETSWISIFKILKFAQCLILLLSFQGSICCE